MKSMLKTICFSTLGLMSSAMIHAQSNYWIVGGQNASEGQFPWIGDLRAHYGDNTQQFHSCGSTLIHPYWVLTAAHCVMGPEFQTPNPTYVRLNTVRANTQTVNPNGGISVEIDTFFRHTSFNNNQPLGEGYDIALIKLKQAVTSIPTVSLPQQADTAQYYQANRIVKAAGWGLVDTINLMGGADTMKWTNTKIIGRSKCNEYYQGNSGIVPVTERVVCAGYEGSEVQSGSAAGDSGGPLWIEVNGTKYVIGVVSGGAEVTTLHQQPGIYTNVAYFRPWIDSVMNAHPTSISRSGGFNDENVSISAGEHSIKLKIGNIPSHTVFVQLCNIEGKVVYKQSLNNPKFQTHHINLSGFAAGMYVLRIYDNAGNHMYRKLQHVSY